jgi:hypothetical protein
MWRRWLRHFATSLEIAGLVSDAVTGSINFMEPQGPIQATVEVAFSTVSRSTSAGGIGEEVVQIIRAL